MFKRLFGAVSAGVLLAGCSTKPAQDTSGMHKVTLHVPDMTERQGLT